jgi:MerR family transcriptional regulator, global nitrogen regulator
MNNQIKVRGEGKVDQDPSYKKRKVITIGVVSELTGLSERQIRYYEERKLIFPERTNRGNRKYSFSDVECLIEIANKREEGVSTDEIRHELNRKKTKEETEKIRKKMLRGQINAQFGVQKESQRKK